MHTHAYAQIEALLSPLPRGSSAPWRASLRDAPEPVLVKWRGAAQGTGPLVAEFVVSRLARLWGAPVPSVRVAELPANYTRVGTDEFWDVLAASVGPNLAMQWIDGRDLGAADMASLGDELQRFMAAVDLCFDNQDRRAANPNLMRGHDGQVWLIDHGACLFFAKLRSPPQFSLAPGHLLAERGARACLAGWRPAPLDARAVRIALQDMPASWLTPLGWSLAALSDAVAQRLARFADWLERSEA